MAIGNYAELQAAIKSWSKRNDLDSVIPDFITLAETRINRNIRIRKMETRVTTSTVSTQLYYGLPTGFVQMRHFKLNTSPVTDLNYLTPERLDNLWAGSTTGKPRVYTLLGDEVRLGPTPDAVYTMEMLYYKKFTALSDSNTTTELLTDCPDIYLYAALLELSAYTEHNEGVMKWTQLFNETISAIEMEDSKDRYSGSALRTVPDFKAY
mgnify:FL=1|jgi:hypothetical protein|tara:strand:+ start:296 stop:922 length:627 start_codon:yes stop_codon:yes gene_type:complete